MLRTSTKWRSEAPLAIISDLVPAAQCSAHYHPTTAQLHPGVPERGDAFLMMRFSLDQSYCYVHSSSNNTSDGCMCAKLHLIETDADRQTQLRKTLEAYQPSTAVVINKQTQNSGGKGYICGCWVRSGACKLPDSSFCEALERTNSTAKT